MQQLVHIWAAANAMTIVRRNISMRVYGDSWLSYGMGGLRMRYEADAEGVFWLRPLRRHKHVLLLPYAWIRLTDTLDTGTASAMSQQTHAIWRDRLVCIS